MTVLESIAVALGIVSVWLSVKEKIWSSPTSTVNVLLYFMIFREQRPYANMGLQPFYAAIAAFGWYHWLFGRAARTRPAVPRTPRLERWLQPLLAAALALGLGVLLARRTDAALPWADGLLTAGSLCAQWMMSRKYLEHWALWVALAVLGHVEWSRSHRAGLEASPAA